MKREIRWCEKRDKRTSYAFCERRGRIRKEETIKTRRDKEKVSFWIPLALKSLDDYSGVVMHS